MVGVAVAGGVSVGVAVDVAVAAGVGVLVGVVVGVLVGVVVGVLVGVVVGVAVAVGVLVGVGAPPGTRATSFVVTYWTVETPLRMPPTVTMCPSEVMAAPMPSRDVGRVVSPVQVLVAGS